MRLLDLIAIFIAIIIFMCILADKFSGKMGMPALILFMGIGMLFGCDGIFKIQFDNFEVTEKACSLALSFIMFYGGFNTKWKVAKPVAAKAFMLSTLGVVITAMLTCGFCLTVLKMSFAESFLTGSVIASTDAASVFSILRKKQLNLRDGTASLLEIESGSNDPVAYMMTIIGIGLAGAGHSGHPVYIFFSQMVYGAIIGVFFFAAGYFILTKTNLISEGLDTVFMIGLILICFGLSDLSGGNGFISVYLMGILIGNSPIRNKKIIIPFFDGITGMAQIFIFFLLGLLVFPHKLPGIVLPALGIMLFMTLAARPLAVFLILKPFKCSNRQCLLVSWAGLRGAASIVFSIMVVASGVGLSRDLFHIVFMISLFSVSIQGTLLPLVAKKLSMVDEESDVRKTFNDYQEESAITLMRMYIPEGHNWENKKIREVSVPTGSLAIMIKRGGETLIPKGDTKILANDCVILSVPAYEPREQENLEEIHIDKNHEWYNRSIAELNLPADLLIALIIRGEENLIPDGNTVIMEEDIVVIYH